MDCLVLVDPTTHIAMQCGDRTGTWADILARLLTLGMHVIAGTDTLNHLPEGVLMLLYT